jgi:uncharacterized repeat protein (TIGR03803 family)
MIITEALIGRMGILVTVLALGCAAGIALGQTDGPGNESAKFFTLHSFNGLDGANPNGELTQATNGEFYGTTMNGGANCLDSGGCGTIFKIAPSGKLTTLYSLCSQAGCTDGSLPTAGLIQATNGGLYGPAANGGLYNSGAIFKITQTGTFTALYSFCAQSGCPDGYVPQGLVQAANGYLYGTTEFDGAALNSLNGTVFEITPGGALTTLYSFCDGCGSHPNEPLIQAANGDLYGVTTSGGKGECNGGSCGTIFKVSPTGVSTFYSPCPQHTCQDGNPPTALIQATNGDFYGTTLYGGAGVSCPLSAGCGTLFKLTPTGTLTTLYNLCSQPGCTDGYYPNVLIQAADGNLYGTTQAGGANGGGTIFKITPSGLSTLYSFCSQPQCSDGTDPSGLMQGTDGVFYGTTESGGNITDCAPNFGCGTVFALSVGQAPFVQTRPTIGVVGETVTILGDELKGATSVTFNGTPATILLDDATVILTKVPTGATTGKVQVVTPNGTLMSNVAFEVAP